MSDKDALLNDLRDVAVPDVAATLAPGWWLLMLGLGLVLFVIFLLRRKHKTRLWQRQARMELQKIRDQQATEPSMLILSRCSQLARKIVLAVDHREQVASLHGEAWLDKLDDICARPEFSQGIGRLLLDQPYQKKPVVAAHDVTALLDSIDVLISSAGRYKPPLSVNARTAVQPDDTARSAS